MVIYFYLKTLTTTKKGYYMITRSQLKVAISQLYARQAFSPSNWYKNNQSPFTDGSGLTSSWAIPYNILRAQFWEIKGNGCVLFNIEWLAILIEEFGLEPNTLTFFSDNEKKSELAKKLEINVITNLQELLTMKFDYVLKNAPYDKGIDIDIELPFRNPGVAYAAFSVIGNNILKDNGICFDVLPGNFMSLPAYTEYRKWLLTEFEILNITIWDNSQHQVFDINMSDIITMVTRKTSNPKNNIVEWVSYNGIPFTVDLHRYEFWPMYKSPLSVAILDAVITDRKKLIECDGGEFDKIDLPPAHFISGNLARSGQRQNPNPQKSFQKDTLKDISNPIWLGYSTKQEKDLQFEWMGSPHYAYVFSMIQSTPKNQPYLFSLMGEHDFQNNDFTSHFKITPTQDKEITEWLALIK